MDNRHKGIPDNPDIMWITSGTYTGRKQHPIPHTRPVHVVRGLPDTGILGITGITGVIRVTGITEVTQLPGYLYTRGTGDHRGTVDTVGTGNYLVPRVTKLPRLPSYRDHRDTKGTGVTQLPDYQSTGD